MARMGLQAHPCTVRPRVLARPANSEQSRLPRVAFQSIGGERAALVPAIFAGVAAVRRRKAATAPKARGGRGGQMAPTLPKEDLWIANLDLEGFGKEVGDLGARLKAEQGPADQKHLYKMISWSRICGIVGLASIWLTPNPLTIFALSLWTHSAWTMMGHHVSHGGYNRTDSTGRYSSRGFALGTLWRRFIDWFDWMLPEAWSIEHNQLHHYRLGEESDPDLLERNSEDWSGMKRKVMPILSMFLWKWAYYAPNTYKELKVLEMRNKGLPLPEGFDPQAPLTLSAISRGKAKGIFSTWELVSKVLGPYFLFRFVLLPLPLYFINPMFFWNAMGNLLMADVASNVHGFIVVVPNHAGDDLYRFSTSCKPKSPTFFLRAVTSSANFATGGNVNDFMHGWLNYQIEHHCWPDLSMLSYQKGQPELKRICEKYGVPYVQDSVWIRLRKTFAIAMGLTKMRRYPEEFESQADRMIWRDSATPKAQGAV